MAEKSNDFYVELKPRQSVSISSVDSEPLRRAPTSAVGRSSSEESLSNGPHATGDGYNADKLYTLDVECPVFEQTHLDLVKVSEAPVAAAISNTDKLVVAEMKPLSLILDMGTPLCLEDGQLIGVVASIVGPVNNVVYVVAKPSEGALAVGEGTNLHYDVSFKRVLYDPMHMCDTLHGTDASYLNDEELPDNVRPDFSDDDKETRWKRERKRQSGAKGVDNGLGDVSSSSSTASEGRDIKWSEMEFMGEEMDGPRQV